MKGELMVLLFWTLTQVLFTICLSLLVYGAYCASKGQLRLHRKLMNAAVFSIILFVLGYVLKLAFLGKESLDTWEHFYVSVLRFHEFFVSVMLLSGGIARFYAHRLFNETIFSQGITKAKKWQLHRMAGKLSLYSGMGAWLLACVILYGMYQRS